MESCRIGKAVIVGLHPVISRFQMLTGIMMDVVQWIDKVRHIVGHGLLLVRGAPNNRSQGRGSSLKHHASRRNACGLVG